LFHATLPAAGATVTCADWIANVRPKEQQIGLSFPIRANPECEIVILTLIRNSMVKKMANADNLGKLRLGWIYAQYAIADARTRQAQIFQVCPHSKTCDRAGLIDPSAPSPHRNPCMDCSVLCNTREWQAICAES
jgi:hypothetical protein